MVIYIKIIIRACPRLTRPTSLRFVRLVRQGRGEPPYREVAQQSFGGFASLSPKGSAASAPPNIGGVSEGRGGFAALRIPSRKTASQAPLFCSPPLKGDKRSPHATFLIFSRFNNILMVTKFFL